MRRARPSAGASAPAAETAAHHVDGVLIPGVRVLGGSARKPAPPPARKKGGRGGGADSGSDASMDGFGEEMQTLKNDIAHLREQFPGAYFVRALRARWRQRFAASPPLPAVAAPRAGGARAPRFTIPAHPAPPPPRPPRAPLCQARAASCCGRC
jgi:hypothetical protein